MNQRKTAISENKKIYPDHNFILILFLKHKLKNKGHRK